MAAGSGKTILRGYELENNFSNLSGGAQWTFARKDGKDWFIKRFVDPVWPKDTKAYDAAYIQKHTEECKQFYHRKRKLYDAVALCDNGNIVTVKDFFLENSKYHIVTERIQTEKVDVTDVALFPAEEKYLLLKTITRNMAALHEQGIVYADIRPDNVLFKRSKAGKLISKLIDFDGSFFEDSPPEPKGVPLSEEYIAPETGELLFDEKEIRLTKKIDVFSLGLLFHLYWTGKMPEYDENQYDFPWVVVLEDGTLTLSKNIPDRLTDLIRVMLSREPTKRPTMEQVFLELKAITEGKEQTPVIAERIAPDSGSDKEPLFKIFFNFNHATDHITEQETVNTETGGFDHELWSVSTEFDV